MIFYNTQKERRSSNASTNSANPAICKTGWPSQVRFCDVQPNLTKKSSKPQMNVRDTNGIKIVDFLKKIQFDWNMLGRVHIWLAHFDCNGK